MRKKNAVQIESICHYILVALMLFGNYSMIERDVKYGISIVLLTVLFAIMCILIMALHSRNGKIEIKQSKLNSFLLLVLISICIIITPGSFTNAGLLYWILPVVSCGICFSTNVEKEKLLVRFVNLTTFFAVCSLVLYIFGSLLHIIPSTRTANFLYSGLYRQCNTYFDLMYEAQKIQGTNLLPGPYRNCGIFIEAPMFNLVLCFAFAAELSFNRVPRKWVIAVLTLTIISTFSTTGIFFLFAMIVIIIINGGKGQFAHLMKVFSVPLVLFAVMYISMTVISSKTQSNMGEASYSIRMDHLTASLRMWVDRPIFGYGYSNVESFYKYTLYDQGLSIGLPALLGRNGLLITLMYVVPWIKRMNYSIKYNKKQLFFWVGTFIIFFLTASIYKTIFIFLLCIQLQWDKTEIDGE